MRYEQHFEELGEQMKVSGATPQEVKRLAGACASLNRLMEQFKKQRLIDFVSSQSWLPNFAFPQNVVKLLVRHAELNEKMRLERDREMGISEYARLLARRSWGFLGSLDDLWRFFRNPTQRENVPRESRPSLCWFQNLQKMWTLV